MVFSPTQLQLTGGWAWLDASVVNWRMGKCSWYKEQCGSWVLRRMHCSAAQELAELPTLVGLHRINKYCRDNRMNSLAACFGKEHVCLYRPIPPASVRVLVQSLPYQVYLT